MNGMTIGQVALAAGVSAKMIRYYESIGLVPTAARSDGGYRIYDATAVHTLRFIHRARSFGFPIDRIRVLVGMWQGGKPSRDVKPVAVAHVAALDVQIAALTSMRDALLALAGSCHGDHRVECPILRDLAGDAPPHAASVQR